jgi:hypothetical protein
MGQKIAILDTNFASLVSSDRQFDNTILTVASCI